MADESDGFRRRAKFGGSILGWALLCFGLGVLVAHHIAFPGWSDDFRKWGWVVVFCGSVYYFWGAVSGADTSWAVGLSRPEHASEDWLIVERIIAGAVFIGSFCGMFELLD